MEILDLPGLHASRDAWSTVESMYGEHSSALWTNHPFFQFLPEDMLQSIWVLASLL
jgi:hypothetical protein